MVLPARWAIKRENVTIHATVQGLPEQLQPQCRYMTSRSNRAIINRLRTYGRFRASSALTFRIRPNLTKRKVYEGRLVRFCGWIFRLSILWYPPRPYFMAPWAETTERMKSFVRIATLCDFSCALLAARTIVCPRIRNIYVIPKDSADFDLGVYLFEISTPSKGSSGVVCSVTFASIVNIFIAQANIKESDFIDTY